MEWHFYPQPQHLPIVIPDYVTGMRIDWMDKYANCPEIEILLSCTYESLKVSEGLWSKHPVWGLWITEHADGWASKFAHTGSDGNEGGFGGASYTIKLKDGSTKVLRGPWSSGCYAANQLGYGPYTSVNIQHIGGILLKTDIVVAIGRKYLPEIRWAILPDQLGKGSMMLEPLKPGWDKPKSAR